MPSDEELKDTVARTVRLERVLRESLDARASRYEARTGRTPEPQDCRRSLTIFDQDQPDGPRPSALAR